MAGWLKKFRDDRRFVVIAAAQAQQAADYISAEMLLTGISRRSLTARAPLVLR